VTASSTGLRADPVTRIASMEIRHCDNHDALVGPATAPPVTPVAALPLDAIIVPASRQAHHLDHAVTLARATGCHLVLLCSRQARAAAVRKFLRSRSFGGATVVELPDRYRHELFDFRTSAWIRTGLAGGGPVRDTDLSMKRNIGLALARMVGWKRIFFLDDDIRDFDATALSRTVSMLGQYSSVGMRVTDFPDNSVVCHAHRITGGHQGVNVSGSALAVDCATSVGFFPDIYNEDWLFFYDHAKTGRLGSSGIHITQLRYDPFADPRRAARQEFGDVLAEGLFAQLHDPPRNPGRDSDYWRCFLDARRDFLNTILSRLESSPSRLTPDLHQRVFHAVDKARRTLAAIKAESCEDYVMLWRADIAAWEERLGALPSLPSIKQALTELRLAAREGDPPAWPAQVNVHTAAEMPARAVPASPAMLSALATESALRTVLEPVTTSAVPDRGPSETAGHRRMPGRVDVIAAPVKRAWLIWSFFTASTGLLAEPKPLIAGAGRWRGVLDRWRRRRSPPARTRTR
jgi:hypothetical protein